MDVLTALAAHWRAQGIEPAGGASAKAIQDFEARYGVRLPADLRAYFARLNGTGEDTPDSDMMAFWPLERVRSVAEELAEQGPVAPAAQGLYCFADFSLWSNAYAVRLSGDTTVSNEVVAVYSGVDLILAAPSFEAFLSGYLSAKPEAVLHPHGEQEGKSHGAAT